MVSFTKLDIFCARRSDETLSDSSKNYWLNPCDRAAEIYGLSAREREVLFLLVCGKLFSEIEQELFLSNSTVKTHARHIYEKLGVHGRHELQECILSQFKA
ncbi:MAG: response regulator transcription factor [Actinobacteria bacterium]|nr:response regulator transcription factor [Actinomycetota bacterium]